MTDFLRRDLRYAVRSLLARPGFTVIAVFTLALGIGANAAIFSVVNTVLLRPLPYKDPSNLVVLESFNPQAGKGLFGGVAPADFFDFQDQVRTLDLSMYSGSGINIMGDRPETIPSARVSPNFFETLGVHPLQGRGFTPEEGFIGGADTVVLSYRLWQRRFGGDPSIVGQTVQTDDGPITVVGVMPPGFKFPSYAEAWWPIPRDSGEMRRRSSRYMLVVGRIKPDQSLQAARDEVAAIARQLEEQHPKENQGWGASLTELSEYVLRGGRTPLLLLMGSVGFVLLIACVNVANLLLARAASRRKEMAIRLALGASRLRLLRQLMLESVLLSFIGGAVGSLLAAWAIDALVGLLPRFEWTFQALSNARDDVKMDGSVLAFTLGLSLLTGLIFGITPAYHASSAGINTSLKEGRMTEVLGHRRLRSGLVIAEITLALVLLVGAGLLIRSFVRMRQVDLGYDPRGLMTMSLALPRDNKDKGPFGREVLEKVNQVPGVQSASLMSFATFGGINMAFNIENKPLASGDQNASYSSITPEYFQTLKVPLRAGREFNDFDKAETEPVAIVNETMTRDYFSGEDPVGQKLVIVYLGQRQTRRIVGVVADLKQDQPNQPTRPEVLVPFAQQPWFAAWVVVRTSVPNPLSLRESLQQALWSVDRNRPPAKFESIEEMLAEFVAAPRLYTFLLGVFAGVALILASIGIYGVMSYSVAVRTREIGIRMALGANRANVLKMVVGEGMVLAVAGVSIGLAAAMGLTRLMRALLYGVSETDPVTFCGISALLIATALIACAIPARRATRVDPMVALRDE